MVASLLIQQLRAQFKKKTNSIQLNSTKKNTQIDLLLVKCSRPMSGGKAKRQKNHRFNFDCVCVYTRQSGFFEFGKQTAGPPAGGKSEGDPEGEGRKETIPGPGA